MTEITNFPLIDEFSNFLSDDVSNESVEVLRERLNNMKKLIAERQQTVNDVNEIFLNSKPQSSSIIDGNFLSIAFGGALLVILTG